MLLVLLALEEPRPYFTNRESITGRGLPTGVESVDAGLGVVTLESLLFL